MRRWLVVHFGIGALLFPTLLAAARGDLDRKFGSSGKVTTDFGGNETAWGLAVQPDGKAVVAGTRLDMGRRTTSSSPATRWRAPSMQRSTADWPSLQR